MKYLTVFFDGVCNLCSSSVQVIIKHDKKGQFRFASLQSDYAHQVLPEQYTQPENLESIILMREGKIYEKSTAILLIAKELGGVFSFLYPFLIIPKFVRDAIYTLIAKNRYSFFGKKDACMIPTPELKQIFFD